MRSLSVAFLAVSAASAAVEDKVARPGDAACTDEGECDAASLLQYNSLRTGRGEVQGEATEARSKRDGLVPPRVHEVYTYGAPATHMEPFRNPSSEDECFPGLRAFSLNHLNGRHRDKNGKPIQRLEIRQVDGAAIHNFLAHAWTNSLVIKETPEPSTYRPCAYHKTDGKPLEPARNGNTFEDWRIHTQKTYEGRYKNMTLKNFEGDAIKMEPFKSSSFFTAFAWEAYDTFENIQANIADKMPGWNLVLRTYDQHHSDKDPILIAQEEKTLDCAIAFAGTNNFWEFFTSTTMHLGPYCGYDRVHTGYKNELWTLMNRTGPVIHPILAQCNKVICVGHSLGGALCELFAACANSGNISNAEYRQLIWPQGTPTLMPPANGTQVPPVVQKEAARRPGR